MGRFLCTTGTGEVSMRRCQALASRCADASCNIGVSMIDIHLGHRVDGGQRAQCEECPVRCYRTDSTFHPPSWPYRLLMLQSVSVFRRGLRRGRLFGGTAGKKPGCFVVPLRLRQGIGGSEEGRDVRCISCLRRYACMKSPDQLMGLR